MDYNNFDRNLAFKDVLRKFKRALFIGVSLIMLGFFIAMFLGISFAGDDGYIREDALRDWLYIALIPIILGFIIIFLPFISVKKMRGSYSNLANTNDRPPEQFIRETEQFTQSLHKVRYILIFGVVVLIATFIYLAITREATWTEILNAIF